MIELDATTTVALTLVRTASAGVTLTPLQSPSVVLEADTVNTTLTVQGTSTLSLEPASDEMAVTLAPIHGPATLDFPTPDASLALTLAPVLQATQQPEQSKSLVYDNDTLTRVDNDDGSYTLLTYTDDLLTQVTSHTASGQTTKTKVLNYDEGGNLTGVSVN